MLIGKRRGWEIPERLVTPEALVLGRRSAIAGTVAAAALASPAHAQFSRFFGGSTPAVPAKPLTPLTFKTNDAYPPLRATTDEANVASYNNYYEFGLSKSVASAAAALVTEPWTIEFTGMVAQPRRISYDDIIKQIPLEERIYRHRCVETWAMTVPWVGFPLAKLLALGNPTGSAKYVKFTTLADPKIMPGLGQRFYPWPYTEGLTMAEAANDLTFVSVGMYGKTLPNQDGAPLRLTVPWKYGFKSAKSIVKIEFTDKQPVSFWEQLQDSEYGFWANVNPEVPHPRWSQATETLLGHDERVPTVIWNGYGQWVASMYTGLSKEKLFV